MEMISVLIHYLSRLLYLRNISLSHPAGYIITDVYCQFNFSLVFPLFGVFVVFCINYVFKLVGSALFKLVR